MPHDQIADLQRRMAEAMDAEDYETAADLRDRIRQLRGETPVPGSRLRRQEPGRMGLGTDQQAMAPPAGGTPPARPDPMTSGFKPRKGRR